jgi:hypothetical protein
MKVRSKKKIKTLKSTNVAEKNRVEVKEVKEVKEEKLLKDGHVLKLNLYVIHASNLFPRKQNVTHLINILSVHPRIQLDATMVSKYDPSDLGADDIKRHVNLSKSNDNSLWDKLIKNMHINQVSNALKHHECMRLIAQNPDSKNSANLVIEDDVCYPENIADVIINFTSCVPKDFELMFVGLPGDHRENESGFRFRSIKDVFQILPCCDSYFVNSSSAEKIHQKMLPIKFSTDKILSFVIQTSDVKAKFSIPNLFADGSKVGKFISSLDANNKLLFNAEYVRAYQLLIESGNDAAVLPESVFKECEARLRDSKVSDHPDIIYMKAMMCVKLKKYIEANELFKKADQIYTENQAIINGESEFLKGYINNFKNLQDISC